MNTILKLPAVMQITTLSQSSISRYVKSGTFPKPVKLGDRAVGWVCAEVHEWMKSKIALRDGAKV